MLTLLERNLLSRRAAGLRENIHKSGYPLMLRMVELQLEFDGKDQWVAVEQRGQVRISAMKATQAAELIAFATPRGQAVRLATAEEIKRAA